MDIRLFVKEDGRSPFELWLNELRDVAARGRVFARINRLRLGNFGDAKSLGGGLHELRLDVGPGYRVYFGRKGREVVVLLSGGNKASQEKDIALARNYWRAFKEHSDE